MKAFGSNVGLWACQKLCLCWVWRKVTVLNNMLMEKIQV